MGELAKAKAMTALRRRSGAMLRHDAGSVLPMTAIAIVVLAAMIGGGVDMGRAYQAQTRLQYACDAGVLAGRRAVDVDGYDETAEAKADDFFVANFQEKASDTSGTSFVTSSNDEGQTVVGVASTQVDTAIMSIFGKDQIALTADCEASMSVGNSDIMMVLDVTGSMACTSAMTQSECQSHINANGYSETAHGGTSRLQELRDAMGDFYDTVSVAIEGTNVRARFGFVPYSATVNVGHLLSADWLRDSVTLPSREAVWEQNEDEVIGYEDPVYTTETGTSQYEYGDWYLYSDTRYTSSNNCNANRPADRNWYNNGAPSESTKTEINSNKQRVTTDTTTQPQRYDQYYCYQANGGYYIIARRVDRDRYTYEIATEDPIYGPGDPEFAGWTYRNITFDSSLYKTFATVNQPVGSNGSNVGFNWNGCIEERATEASATFSWSNSLGMNPTGAIDLNIDSMPGSDQATKWSPMWEGLGFRRYAYDDAGGFYYYTQAETAPFGFAPDTHCPDQARHFAVMSETEYDNFVAGLAPAGSTYHDIGMIWGGRLASPTGLFQSTVTESAPNGGGTDRHLIFMTDGYLSPSEKSHSAYGFEWWDPRVTEDGESGITSRHTERFLAVCDQVKAKSIRIWVIAFATELTTDLIKCASTDSSFTATDATTLNEAFQDIAAEVGELRITQ